MFQVLENGKAAEMKDTVLWANSIFQHFHQAQAYVQRWVGPIGESFVPNRPDQKIDYSGYGDMIEIKSL